MSPAGAAALVPVAVLAAALAGCAGGPQARGELRYQLEPGAATLVWPAPPQTPRYAYDGVLVGAPNFVAAPAPTRSALVRLGRWIAGLDADDAEPLRLQRPAALVGDGQGRLYVSDAARKAIFVFDAARGELQLWDRAAPGQGWLSPVGLAVGPGGSLYVADAELARVVQLDAEGRAIATVGRGQLQRPTGLARDPVSGRLYVADTQAHDIKVFDPAGRLERVFGRRGEAPGEFNFPTHLAWAPGRLIVSDTMNARVQVLDGADGRPLQQLGARGVLLGQLVRPKGVAQDRGGRLLVVESFHDTVLVYDAEGRLLLPIGGGWGGGAAGTPGATSGPDHFELPAGLWVDGEDRVYVADQQQGRIVRLRFLGGD